MKKIFFITAIALSMLACNQSEIDSSNQKNDSLVSIINDKDSLLSDFIHSFNEIESNLDSVAAKQRIITLKSNNFNGELKGNRKEQINREIAAINNLMDENRKEIESLEKKLNGSKIKNSILEKTIATLTIQLSRKDYELNELNLRLNSLNSEVMQLATTVDSLTDQNFIQTMVINYQTRDMRKGYFIIAESKTLIKEKIIYRKGGLLGMGKTSTLNEDFDNTLFIPIDITQTTEIPINNSDISIVTSHPSDSYVLENGGSKNNIKNLVIIDPAKFWSTSKYLVVAID